MGKNNKTNKQKYNIICLSNQQWDYPLPTNKKHVMSRMAKLGHNVLFVDPPINTGRLFLRQLLKGQWGLRRMFTQAYDSEFKTLKVFSPLNAFPSDSKNTKRHIKKINRLSEKYFNLEKKTILWVYHVQIKGLKDYIENLTYDTLVYDCVDNYLALPENSTLYSATVSKQDLIEQEKMLAQGADCVFATTPALVDKLKRYSGAVHFTPNVGNYKKFKEAQKIKENDAIPEDLKKIRRPRIGFTGAVDEYKFDRELVRKIAKDHPDYNFVIIGPFALKDAEASKEKLGFNGFDNVTFLGSRPYNELPKYYAGFDVFMIPFKLNDYTVGGCFPVKFHESLAAGLPTVVTDLPAYYPFGDVCYLSKGYDEFSENIKKALFEDSPQKIKQRMKVASQNTWDGKVDRLLKLVARTLL